MGEIAKREAVKKAYPNSVWWPIRVDRMLDDQIQAIYLRLVRQGRIKN